MTVPWGRVAIKIQSALLALWPQVAVAISTSWLEKSSHVVLDSFFAFPYPWWVSPESPWCWNFYPSTSQSSKIYMEFFKIRLHRPPVCQIFNEFFMVLWIGVLLDLFRFINFLGFCLLVVPWDFLKKMPFQLGLVYWKKDMQISFLSFYIIFSHLLSHPLS